MSGQFKIKLTKRQSTIDAEKWANELIREYNSHQVYDKKLVDLYTQTRLNSNGFVDMLDQVQPYKIGIDPYKKDNDDSITNSFVYKIKK